MNKQLVVDDGTVNAEQFCYFPDGGAKPLEYPRRSRVDFHDTLSLTLRDYPFDDAEKPVLTLDLVPDQTDTHETPQRPAKARVEYVERDAVLVWVTSLKLSLGLKTMTRWSCSITCRRFTLVLMAPPMAIR